MEKKVTTNFNGVHTHFAGGKPTVLRNPGPYGAFKAGEIRSIPLVSLRNNFSGIERPDEIPLRSERVKEWINRLGIIGHSWKPLFSIYNPGDEGSIYYTTGFHPLAVVNTRIQWKPIHKSLAPGHTGIEIRPFSIRVKFNGHENDDAFVSIPEFENGAEIDIRPGYLLHVVMKLHTKEILIEDEPRFIFPYKKVG